VVQRQWQQRAVPRADDIQFLQRLDVSRDVAVGQKERLRGELVVPEVQDSAAGSSGAGAGGSCVCSPSNDRQPVASRPSPSSSSTRMTLLACVRRISPLDSR